MVDRPSQHKEFCLRRLTLHQQSIVRCTLQAHSLSRCSQALQGSTNESGRATLTALNAFSAPDRIVRCVRTQSSHPQSFRLQRSRKPKGKHRQTCDRFASELTEVQRMATARVASHRRYSRRRRRCLMRHHRPGMAGTRQAQVQWQCATVPTLGKQLLGLQRADVPDLDPRTSHDPVEYRVYVRVWCVLIAQADEVFTAAPSSCIDC